MNRKARRALKRKAEKAEKTNLTAPGTPVPEARTIDEAEAKIIWQKVIEAVEAEPRDATFIKGASGISHPTVAVGVDEGKKRLILISGESDARAAALAQADIQAALRSYHVLVARPLAVNLAPAAQMVKALSGRSSFSLKDLPKEGNQEALSEFIGPVIGNIIAASSVASTRAMPQIIQILEQLSNLSLEGGENAEDATVGLDGLAAFDATKMDRQYGICPFPLYDFDIDDFERIITTPERDEVRALLASRGVFQFFFPAPDQLALGLIERSDIKSPDDLIRQVDQAPELGHPLGKSELAPERVNVGDLIEMLKGKNLVVEGEYSYEVTEEGKSVRQTVRYKPREGLLSKLINRFELKIDLKDLFRSGPG